MRSRKNQETIQESGAWNCSQRPDWQEDQCTLKLDTSNKQV